MKLNDGVLFHLEHHLDTLALINSFQPNNKSQQLLATKYTPHNVDALHHAKKLLDNLQCRKIYKFAGQYSHYLIDYEDQQANNAQFNELCQKLHPYTVLSAICSISAAKKDTPPLIPSDLRVTFNSVSFGKSDGNPFRKVIFFEKYEKGLRAIPSDSRSFTMLNTGHYLEVSLKIYLTTLNDQERQQKWVQAQRAFSIYNKRMNIPLSPGVSKSPRPNNQSQQIARQDPIQRKPTSKGAPRLN